MAVVGAFPVQAALTNAIEGDKFNYTNSRRNNDAHGAFTRPMYLKSWGRMKQYLLPEPVHTDHRGFESVVGCTRDATAQDVAVFLNLVGRPYVWDQVKDALWLRAAMAWPDLASASRVELLRRGQDVLRRAERERRAEVRFVHQNLGRPFAALGPRGGRRRAVPLALTAQGQVRRAIRR